MSAPLVEELAAAALEAAPEASDLLFTPGRPIQAEVHGLLTPVATPAAPPELAPFHVEVLADMIMGSNRRARRELETAGACDLAYESPGLARFRVNIFRRRGSLAVIMRRLPEAPPGCDDLGLPQAIRDMARRREGLILVAGAAGAGKSTTLAALLDQINVSRAVHVISLEDPVEFVHRPKLATISQRELGADFPSFAEGLRAALRQAPKVILVGEIRDRETVEAALRACETGHLVLGTVHASDCGQTVNRLIGMFETRDARFIRGRLAAGLVGVAAQRLPPRLGGGRVAVFEIMVNCLRVRELVENGETEDTTFRDVIETGSALGMRSFDQGLADLFARGEIDEETGLAFCGARQEFIRAMDAIRHAKGVSRPAPALELDLETDPETPRERP